MRITSSKWCMASSFSENLRFRPSTRKRESGVFKNLRSGERFWKDKFSVIVFTGCVRTVGRKKNVRFQIKTDTCGQGLKEIAIYIWALYDGLRKSHATFLVACVADSLNLGTDRYFFEGGGGGGWKIFSCCHCRGDMAVRMRKVLAIPQSCVVWPLLSEGLLIFCVSLFLQALYFSLRTIYFSAYSLCKRFIQNFHPIPLITPSKKSLKSISIWVSSDKFGCNAGNFLSQSLRSKTRTNHLFATVVSFSCLTLDAFVSFDMWLGCQLTFWAESSCFYLVLWRSIKERSKSILHTMSP